MILLSGSLRLRDACLNFTALHLYFGDCPPMKVIGDSRLSRKYQATVPSYVRDLLRLGAGDLIVFVEREKGEVVLKKGELRIKD